MKININESSVDRSEYADSLKTVLKALKFINGKWKLALIHSLLRSPMRFCEMQNQIGGISPKTLAKQLKDLMKDGFVKRNVYPTTPVSIIYEATSFSHTLQKLLNELALWGDIHMEDLSLLANKNQRC